MRFKLIFCSGIFLCFLFSTIASADIINGGVVTGTGAVGSVGAMAYAETGTGVGSAVIESLDSVRYRAGHMCYCDPSVLMPTPEAGVNIYIGFLNGTDGLAWGYQGETLGFWFIEGGNVNFIPRDQWDDPLYGNGESGYNVGRILRLHIPESSIHLIPD